MEKAPKKGLQTKRAGTSRISRGIKKKTENIELFFLPAYSPDLNPIERLWKYFKEEFLNNELFKTLAKIKATVYEGLKNILNSCDLVKSICTI